MKKIICMFIMLSLLVCIVGCSQAEDSGNQLVQDYSEEYEVSPYGNEEELDTLKDLKISLSTENRCQKFLWRAARWTLSLD